MVSYWKQALIVSDNRIPAMGFRRVFQEVMDERGWDTPDALMEVEQVVLTTQPWWEQFLPLVTRNGSAFE